MTRRQLNNKVTHKESIKTAMLHINNIIYIAKYLQSG